MTDQMSKYDRLVELNHKRKNVHWEGYSNPAEYYVQYDSDEWVSPYSKNAHNVDATIMLILQDWASRDKLNKPFDSSLAQLGYDKNLPTNKNIKRLLRDHLNLDLADVFATNLFPFIKAGKMSANIPMRDLRRAAEEFASPQIAIVQPRIVLAFGLKTFNTLRGVCNMRNVPSMAQAIESPFMNNGTELRCLASPGRLGTKNRNASDPDQVDKDWLQIAARPKEMERE